jgi:hypothetical protein
MTNRTNDPKVLDSLIEELSRYRGVLVAGYLVLLALFVGWASLTVAADVLRLRRLRQDRLRKLSIGSASFTSDFE